MSSTMSKITILGSQGTVRHPTIGEVMSAFTDRQFRDIQMMLQIFQIGGEDALREMARNLDGVLCQTILHVSADTAETLMVVMRKRLMDGKEAVRRLLEDTPLNPVDSLIQMFVVLEDCQTREGWRHVGMRVIFIEEEVKPAIPEGV